MRFTQFIGMATILALLSFGTLVAVRRLLIVSDVVVRSAAPSGRVEALVVAESAGAFGSALQRICIVPAGASPKSGSEVLNCMDCGEIRLEWRSDGHLDVWLASGAKFRDFANTIRSPDYPDQWIHVRAQLGEE